MHLRNHPETGAPFLLRPLRTAGEVQEAFDAARAARDVPDQISGPVYVPPYELTERAMRPAFNARSFAFGFAVASAAWSIAILAGRLS